MTHTADIVVAGAGHNSLITAASSQGGLHECLVAYTSRAAPPRRSSWDPATGSTPDLVK